MFGFGVAILLYYMLAVPTLHKCMLTRCVTKSAAFAPPRASFPLTPRAPFHFRRLGFGLGGAYALFVLVYSLAGLKHTFRG